MEKETSHSPERGDTTTTTPNSNDSKSRRRRLRRRNRTNSLTKNTNTNINTSAENNNAEDIEDQEPEIIRVEQDCWLLAFPDEVLLRVLSNLDPQELVRIATASIRLFYLVEESILWKRHCAAMNQRLSTNFPIFKGESWKKFYFSLIKFELQTEAVRKAQRDRASAQLSPITDLLFVNEQILSSTPAVFYAKTTHAGSLTVTSLPRLIYYNARAHTTKKESIRLPADAVVSLTINPNNVSQNFANLTLSNSCENNKSNGGHEKDGSSPSNGTALESVNCGPPFTLTIRSKTLSRDFTAYTTTQLSHEQLLAQLRQFAQECEKAIRLNASVEKFQCHHCGAVYSDRENHRRACFWHPGDPIEVPSPSTVGSTVLGVTNVSLVWSCCKRPAARFWRPSQRGCQLRGAHVPSGQPYTTVDPDHEKFFIF